MCHAYSTDYYAHDHDMEMHFTLLALCGGNLPVTGGFPSQCEGQCCGVWCFLCCHPEQAAEQTVNLPVIWDTMMLMWHHCNAEPFTLGQGCNLCPLLYFPWVYIPVTNIQELMHLKMNDFWTKICHGDILIHFWNETVIVIHHTLKQQLIFRLVYSWNKIWFWLFEYTVLYV